MFGRQNREVLEQNHVGSVITSIPLSRSYGFQKQIPSIRECVCLRVCLSIEVVILKKSL